MKAATPITCVFLDVGGVLLSDAWDRHASKRPAVNLKLELAELEERHHRTFETYEEGGLTLDDYLSLVVFHQKRASTRVQCRHFMFAKSKPHPEMIGQIAQLRAHPRLKIVVVSNERRELNAHRIRKFKLDRWVDCFVTSCFVRVRKPDADIFRLALDIAQVPARQVVYIENTRMFVEVAERLGIQTILHIDERSTLSKLASFGSPGNKDAVHASA